MDDIKKFLEDTFKCNLIIKEPQEGNVEKIEGLTFQYKTFKNLIDILSKSVMDESNLALNFGVELTKITTPLWVILDTLISHTFGTTEKNMIFWHLLNQDFEEEEEIKIYFVLKKGQKIDISTPLKLWNQIKKLRYEKM